MTRPRLCGTQPPLSTLPRFGLAIQRPDESETIRQIGEMWDAARAEFARLRELAERAVEMSQANTGLNAARSEREAALLKLGEAFYKLVNDGQANVPPALKRVLGEVKAKDSDFLRQQADIAAILKEADAMAEKVKKAAPVKKKPVKA
ncbi:MAG: hypothetical protein QM765_03315 [Myxococcales bacterium]